MCILCDCIYTPRYESLLLNVCLLIVSINSNTLIRSDGRVECKTILFAVFFNTKYLKFDGKILWIFHARCGFQQWGKSAFNIHYDVIVLYLVITFSVFFFFWLGIKKICFALIYGICFKCQVVLILCFFFLLSMCFHSMCVCVFMRQWHEKYRNDEKKTMAPEMCVLFLMTHNLALDDMSKSHDWNLNCNVICCFSLCLSSCSQHSNHSNHVLYFIKMFNL